MGKKETAVSCWRQESQGVVYGQVEDRREGWDGMLEGGSGDGYRTLLKDRE